MIYKINFEIYNCVRYYMYLLVNHSSSSCRATGTDILDPLSPLLPIVHRLWQVFRAAFCILT